MSAFEVKYSAIDRMVHNVAMSNLEMQKSLARMEDEAFDKANPNVRAGAPVFITSLPRAGTTLLLEVVAAAPQFVSHSYRDMPFLLAPLTWESMSKGFRKPAEARERAHGDGMLVDFDSVEAFEEVIWRAFWKDHFKKDRITPWRADEEDRDGEFLDFMRRHMRKMIVLGRARRSEARIARYVSKNNANISRLAWIERHFPDAAILAPYREPGAHLTSLSRQHANFLKVHAEDKFTLRYMETIGHLEFGKALRPIDFDGWLARAGGLDPSGLDFWAEYWLAAFTAILREAGPRTTIFSYDRLCASPEAGLAVIEKAIDAEAGALTASAARFRAAGPAPALAIAPERAQRITEMLARLDARAAF